jgi:lysophospholipid acyltransferase
LFSGTGLIRAGSLFIRIPSTRPTLKHLFSIFVASFYFVPVLNQGLPFLTLLGDVLATYFVALTVQGPRMPWIVFG